MGGPQLEISLYKIRGTLQPTSANVPIEQMVEWEIRVNGGKYGLYQSEVDLRVIFTNLDTGESIPYTGLSNARPETKAIAERVRKAVEAMPFSVEEMLEFEIPGSDDVSDWGE